MIKSKLSDSEWEDLLSLMLGNRYEAVREYLNRLFYEKGLGNDGCARPLHFREKEAKGDHTCFAVGYIEKLVSFMEETAARKPVTVIADTKEFADRLKQEINQFFKEE